jgi:PAS domain S-box-containing protein
MEETATKVKTRVLVVEDELLIAHDIQRRLQQMGYHVVDVVSTGVDALRAVAEHAPDVVLMDIRLRGGMSGVETAAQVRAHHDVPVVYLTAHADEEMLERVKVTEPFGYILKPFQDRELRSNIEIALYRHEQEQRLRESEQRYRTLFEKTTNPILIIDPQGNYINANAAALRFVECSREALLSKNVADFAPPGREDMIAEEHEPLWEAGGTVETPYAIGGRVKTLELTITPTVWQGRRVIFGMGKDITERKRAERERERLLSHIQVQARRMQQIMDAVPEGVILLDEDRRIILHNPVARDHLALLSEAQGGDILRRLGERALGDLLPPAPEGLWHDVSVEGTEFEVVARPVAAPTPAEASEIPAGWVLVTRDVTREREARRYTQQQERLAAVGQLAAGIAHDFNNILAVISLYVGMSLRISGLPAKLYERLEVMDQQARRASDLIQQILDFSRRAVLQRRPMDLATFLKEQVKILQRTLPEHIQVALRQASSSEHDVFTVNADPTRIQQALMNLAFNARDAMPEGGELTFILKQQRVSACEDAPISGMQSGNWVGVAVRDTGSGIPPEAMDHIFEPFFTTKTPDRGYGLGLAQVYGIVKQHEGYIMAESEVGVGSTFTFYLPALAQDVPAMDPDMLAELPQGAGQTVLVVEDNAATRVALVEGLELLDYRVLRAQHGRIALEVFEQHRDEIALVLSDVVMPEMGGIELLEALSERAPEVKVVLLTGHPLQEELAHLEASEAVACLQKPVQIHDLAVTLARALADA